MFNREKEGQEKPVMSTGKKRREDRLAFSFFLLLPLPPTPPPVLISVVEKERQRTKELTTLTVDMGGEKKGNRPG